MGSFFLVKSRVIEWRSDKNEIIGRVELTNETINNLEVQDEQKIIDLIKSLVGHRKIGNVIVYLDDSIVFAKKFAISAHLMTDIEDLWSEVPISPDVMAKKVLISLQGAMAFATNQMIYRSVVKGITSAGGEVSGVVALSARAFLPKRDVQDLDFSGEEVVDVRPHMKKSYVKILTLILILAIFGTGFLAGWKYRLRVKSRGDDMAAVTTTIQPTQSVEPSVTPKVRNFELRIKVLNATETTGLAAQVKDILTGDGYTKIETANLKEATASQSSILVTEKIGQSDKEYLVHLLEPKLGTLNIDTATGSDGFDIVVTINRAF